MQNQMARKRKGRVIDGIVLLDKPLGMSSNAALQKVKRLYQAQKAGHTGSLDPLASGLLPICLGKATKLASHLLATDKCYVTTAQLGETRETGDAEGQVLQRRAIPPDLSVAKIEAVLAKFKGQQQQIPPMYSALKHQGQALYKLARQGKTVVRPARDMFIYDLDLLAFNDSELQLSVRCSKGTYIRTLVEDIGEVLGCGAFVKSLRRTAVGTYGEAQMLDFPLLEKQAEQGLACLDELILPMSSATPQFPEIILSINDRRDLIYGHTIYVKDNIDGSLVNLLDDQHRWLGLGQVETDRRLKIVTWTFDPSQFIKEINEPNAISAK